MDGGAGGGSERDSTRYTSAVTDSPRVLITSSTLSVSVNASVALASRPIEPKLWAEIATDMQSGGVNDQDDWRQGKHLVKESQPLFRELRSLSIMHLTVHLKTTSVDQSAARAENNKCEQHKNTRA